ncbi:MAG: relaxase domain-containing protein [Kordiimonadaceae bacterium]|nr:relaxase domain-containing protein [Kordiimonadaceae bacterium]
MVARLTKSTSVSGALNYHANLESQDEQLKGLDRPGEFQGQAAEWLEIHGDPADRAPFKALLEGKNPVDGSQIVQVHTGKTERVPGWDYTFSPDKSVSTVWAVAPNDIAQAIEKAQRDASQRAMQYVEANFAITRSGRNGVNKENVAGLIWSRHDHFLSRALDPQLHTHNFVFNAGLKENGKWGSLHSRSMYRAQKQAQLIYHAELAQRLEGLGFKLEMHSGDNFRIAGIPAAVNAANSNRRAAILEATRDYSFKTPSSFENAALMTRQSKVKTDLNELLEIWNKRHAALGFGPENVRGLLAGSHSRQGSHVGLALSGLVKNRHDLDHTFGKIAKRTLPSATSKVAGKSANEAINKMLGSITRQGLRTLKGALAPSTLLRRAVTASRSANNLGGGRSRSKPPEQVQETPKVIQRTKEKARER